MTSLVAWSIVAITGLLLVTLVVGISLGIIWLFRKAVRDEYCVFIDENRARLGCPSYPRRYQMLKYIWFTIFISILLVACQPNNEFVEVQTDTELSTAVPPTVTPTPILNTITVGEEATVEARQNDMATIRALQDEVLNRTPLPEPTDIPGCENLNLEWHAFTIDPQSEVAFEYLDVNFYLKVWKTENNNLGISQGLDQSFLTEGECRQLYIGSEQVEWLYLRVKGGQFWAVEIR